MIEPQCLRVVQRAKRPAHANGQARVGGVEVAFGAKDGKTAAGPFTGPGRITRRDCVSVVAQL